MEAKPEEKKGDAPANGAAVAKKVDMKDHNQVFLDALNTINQIQTKLKSYSVRLFGTSSTYKKKFGLPDDAPTKQTVKTISAMVTKLRDEVFRKYSEGARKKPIRYNKKGELVTAVSSRTNQSRMVVCSEKLTAAMKLSDWGLLTDWDPKKGHCTHAAVTGHIANVVKLCVLQNQQEPKFWSANAFIDGIFGEDYAKSNLDKMRMTFPKVQSVLKYHLETVPTGTYEPKVEAAIREKCSREEAGSFGHAIASIKKLRDEMTVIQKKYVTDVKSRNAAKAERPGQEVTQMWERAAAEDEKQYIEIGGKVRKAAESYGFPLSQQYPPPIEDILKKPAPKPRDPKAKKPPVKLGAKKGKVTPAKKAAEKKE
jgi:hypothetical protein